MPFTPLARYRASRLVAAHVLLAASLTLAGCDLLTPREGPTPDQTPTSPEASLLPEGTTEVTVAPGETVQVSLGTGNIGVGDAWDVINETEPDVASADVVTGDAVSGYTTPEESQGAVGDFSPFAVEITGEQAGTSTITVQYCTRTKVAPDCDQTQGTLDAPVDPIDVTVTVTE